MLIIIKSCTFSKFSRSKYFGQISLDLVFSILMELHRISMLNFNKYGKQQYQVWNCPRKIWMSKITHKNRNQHITIIFSFISHYLSQKITISKIITILRYLLYIEWPLWSCIKFESMWRTQICPKYYEWQNFEKLNIKIVISM